RDDRPAGLLSPGQFGSGAVHHERAHAVPDLARRNDQQGAPYWPLPQGRLHLVLLADRSSRVARRQDRGPLLGRPGSHEERCRPAALRHLDQEAGQAGPAREPALRPPGRRLAARRQDPAVRPERARRPARHTPDLRLQPGHEEGLAARRPGLYAPILVARRSLDHGDPADAGGHRYRDPQRSDRSRGPAGHERRQLVVTGLVAARRCDRLSPHRGPDRRPQDGRPDRQRAELDRRPAARRDRVQRPGRELGRQLVHPARPAPGNPRPECPDHAQHQPERPGPVRQAVLMAGYLERLAGRSAGVGSVLCLGLDPDPTALPPGFPATVAGIERFCLLLLDAAGPYAAAVKPNLAFFEAHGAPGIAALERIRAAVPSSIPVVADAKRGDIGTTAASQAVALFDVLGADAITASPYVGAEGLAPFLDRSDRYVYVLCRTSNRGADELQGLPVAADASGTAPAELLHEPV